MLILVQRLDIRLRRMMLLQYISTIKKFSRFVKQTKKKNLKKNVDTCRWLTQAEILQQNEWISPRSARKKKKKKHCEHIKACNFIGLLCLKTSQREKDFFNGVALIIKFSIIGGYYSRTTVETPQSVFKNIRGCFKNSWALIF